MDRGRGWMTATSEGRGGRGCLLLKGETDNVEGEEVKEDVSVCLVEQNLMVEHINIESERARPSLHS